MVERVRSRGLIEEIELEQKREQTDSVLRFLHARVAPLGTNFVLVLCDDQTESKRVDAVRRDFVANVSHELKTPIGAMALLAEARRSPTSPMTRRLSNASADACRAASRSA